MNNYLQTANPFQLPAPPAWWLKAMWDMDVALVMFPSTLRHAYIIARRRSHSLRMPALVELDKALLKTTAGGDGDLMATHNLVYVDNLIGWGLWTMQPLNDLKKRDIWAAGGADKFTDTLEANEAAVIARRRKTLEDDLIHRAGDAWRSYQARTGRRNQHANDRAVLKNRAKHA